MPQSLRTPAAETLVASAARTASGDSGELDLGESVAWLRAQLDVTAASGTSPTLDVVLEDTLDGTNWNAAGTFAQKTAAGREVINLAPRGDAQPAGFAWPFHPRRFRVRWTVGGTTPSFTFSVIAAKF